MISLDTETKSRLLKLLTSGIEEIPASNFRSCQTAGVTYISSEDLIHWLTLLADSAVSDQKQEAYRGLRDYLHLSTRS